MIYIMYLIVAAAVVYLSLKASEYVDLIDKTTNLSGAFLGGILLSAVTSLPELFTSLSATLGLNEPGLCIGNILGSNLFNVTVLAVFVLTAFRAFGRAAISSSHLYVTAAVFVIYMVMALNMMHILDFEIATVSITSWTIMGLYGLGLKYMAVSEESAAVEESETVTDLSMRQIIVRFAVVSVGIVVLSIVITYITDIIAKELELGAGLAGAIFLGVATSLPEVSSTLALFRIGNYNIAVGNIIGSNLFNFLILTIADVMYLGQGIYDFSDVNTVRLLVFGAFATPLFWLLLSCNNKFIRVACPLGIVGCYLGFLL